MRHLIIIIITLMIQPIYVKGDNNQLYKQLDAALAQRAHYVELKEKSLNEIKQGAKYVTSNEDKLKLYEQLANEYKAYEYDSAMTYVNKGLILAQKNNNILFNKRFQLSQTRLLITRGFYAEAKEILQKIEPQEDSHDYQFLYYYTLYELYNNWSTYCENNEFSKNYNQLKVNYLKKAIELSPKKDAFYYYLLGELYYYSNHPNNNRTIQYYKKALSMEKANSRLHAMTAFALSEIYQKANNLELMEHYLLVAAISDITSATKENVALQDIALFIYKHKTRSLNKAQEYINLSLEDAYAYNNRLRRIEISSKLQMITNAYTDDIRATNSMLYIALSVIFLLLLGVGLSSLFIRKKNKLLKQKKDEITATSAKMEVLNSQLHLINDELKDTNQKRERLVKVYIDLCYKNIERNSKLRTLAVRKIKANQSKELLSLLSSSSSTERENKEFLTEFDKSFLSLYPTFITELNKQLTESAHIQLKENGEMPPILRVCALLRLGITESSKIAGILSYSPQTIYNYRSLLKNNAIDKEHFEENVLRLCMVIAD
ncbi:DUF6377 domain-containing protein [Segatella copri]|uniref:DUF6377 domain-containing protein n=1 Tax=Segatella copri TaxID=165179 RepID=A0AAW4N2N9_9BACT|nr:DUF6377 domain-containing protein [Segatella copri]MBV3387765.1 hypothetical protein [Segatella copri]MBV3395655.1 hypothetical protein [Segatella copri]MBV3405269.1 hypothetical protein [Segatella copri]